MPATLRITYRKSAIGYSRRQKDTIRSLGFKRLGQTLEVDDSPVVRGMVRHVHHLVDVEERAPAPGEPGAPGAPGEAGGGDRS